MRHFIRVLVVLAVAVAALTSPARAAGPDFIGLTQLRQMLAASPGGISGYFLTVAGGPSQADQLPVPVRMTVRAVADGQGPDGALILFEADMTDPVMEHIGGIAAGMSGSPMYIDDAGQDKVIAAVSYGDSFTLNGLGLATPIEYMLDTQGQFPPADRSLTLHAPLATDSAGMIDRVRITPGLTRTVAPAGTVVVSPLFGMQATGLPVASRAYKKLAQATTTAGIRLLSPGASPCQLTGYSAPFAPGAAIGTYLSLGSFAFGGYGTATYDDGDIVMAYGHPLLWTGRSDAFITNVWTQGIWGSSQEPYKLGCPAALRGVLTQDRSAGIAANLAQTPVQIPVTSTVTVTDDQPRTRGGSTQVAPITFTTDYGPPLAAAAVSEPVYRAANQQTMAGSARSRTSVVVSDGSTDFTISRSNVWDSSDALYDASADTEAIIGALTSVPGVTPRVRSIDLQADIDRSHRAGQIVGVRAPALEPGANTITVLIKQAGKPQFEVPVVATLPAGVVLDGSLGVLSGSEATDSESVAQPQSVAQLVEQIQQTPTNNAVVVQYQGSADPQPLEVGRVSTDYALTGAAYPITPSGQLTADQPTVELGQQVRLDAMLTGPPDGTLVTLQERPAGSAAWQTVGTSALTTTDAITSAVFLVIPQVNTSYRSTWPGDGEHLGWTATTDVSVAPPVTLQAHRVTGGWRFRISSAPQAAGTAVTVQTKSNGRWRAVVAGTLDARGEATLVWKKAPARAKVRAVLAATSRLNSATSPATTLSATTVLVDTAGPATPSGNVTISAHASTGKAITGIGYRVQRRDGAGWIAVANGTLDRSTRVWLANGDYRVVLPKQKRVPETVRETVTMESAAVVITGAKGGRGRATVRARPQIPLQFTVQQRAGDQWRTIGAVRTLIPPRSRWSRPLAAGRYRFAFPEQSGYNGAVSQTVRVR